MRGAGIIAFGAPVEMLRLEEPQHPTATEVVIDVSAAGVGNWDELVRIGTWQTGARPPMALGVEAAGKVAVVGDAVLGFAVDDDVLSHPLPLKGGTWAERTVAPAATVARKPPAISYEAAAAFPVPALTALQVLDEALALERGDTLLVNGAGGVTGGMLVQLAVTKVATVIATASQPNAARLFRYGAHEVLDYHDKNWPEIVREITGGDGASKAANAARGGASEALRAVVPGGRLATITGDPPQPERNVSISNVYVRPDGDQLTRLTELLATGALRVEISSVRPIEDAATALAEAVSGHAHGAPVISLTEKS